METSTVVGHRKGSGIDDNQNIFVWVDWWLCPTTVRDYTAGFWTFKLLDRRVVRLSIIFRLSDIQTNFLGFRLLTRSNYYEIAMPQLCSFLWHTAAPSHSGPPIYVCAKFQDKN